MAIIRREEGGSRLSIKSGGAFNFADGGSVNLVDGAKLSLGTDATTNNTAYEVFKMGGNTFWYSASTASPVFSGSPGDLLWLVQSASTAMWVNTSDGTAGSVWEPIRHAGVAGASVIDDLR
jgi:hypothetical protein